MGDPKTTIWQEVTQGAGKVLMWIAYISIGAMAKLAFDSRTSELSRKQMVIKSALSIFAGFLAAVLCEVLGYQNWQKVIVPVATLLGESLIAYLMSNWQTIVSKILPAWFQKGKQTKS